MASILNTNATFSIKKDGWNQEMRPRPILDILLSYLLFFSCVFVELFLSDSVYYHILFVFFASLTLHRLGLFVHAAAHGEFHSNRKKSDRIYRWVLGWFFGIDIDNYRKVHFAHHRLHGRPNPDPEDTYSQGFTVGTLLRLIRKKDPASLESKKFLRVDGGRSKGRMLRLGAMMFHLGLLIAFQFRIGFLGSFLYGFSVFVGLPAITHFRNCLEHTPFDGVPVSRNFEGGVVAFFLGAAGFQLHKEHHDNPGINYWMLNQDVQKASYFEVIAALVNHAD